MIRGLRRCHVRSTVAVVAFAFSLAPTLRARATFSIVAADRATGQIGGAGASCVGRSSLYQIYGSAPGHGVVHAQALFSNVEERLPEAVRLVSMDVAPADVLAAVTDPSFDAESQSRQYGIADLAGRTAAFTGVNTLPFADDLQGETGTFVYAAQGNILSGPEVLAGMEAGFRDDAACDLAERLLEALEGGGAPGIGDSRCTDEGIPADGAYIQVDASGEPAGEHLLLRVDDTAPEDPLVLLRAMFDDWRATNPCPAPPPPLPPPPAPDAGVAPAGDASSPDGALRAAAGRDAGCSASPGVPSRRRAIDGSIAPLVVALVLALRRRRPLSAER